MRVSLSRRTVIDDTRTRPVESRLGMSCFWFEPSDENHPAVSASRQNAIAGLMDRRHHCGRDPDLGRKPTNHSCVLRRRDTDHGQCLIVERDRLSYKVRIRVEPALPETVADHSDWISSRHDIFICGKSASLLRGDAQDVEVVSRNCFAPDLLDLVRVTKLELLNAVGSEAAENVIVIAKVDVARIGSGLIRLFALADVELHELFRI
jgi:hypothetical protein